MKEIPLSQGKYALVDDTDYSYLSQFTWSACQYKKGYTFYAVRRDASTGRLISMHRALLGYPRGVRIDHRDGNGLNNQRENIRQATASQNQHNRPGWRNAQGSSYKGVDFVKRRGLYRSRICVARQQMTLGLFENEVDAALAYDVAARQYHGEFAWCNFPVLEMRKVA